MPAVKEFRLPDVGEGLTEGEIVRWMVQPGDVITVNQNIVEVETAKVTVELPSPFAGVVTALLYDEGVTVDVGAPIIRIDTDPDGAEAPDPQPAAEAAAPYQGAVPSAASVADVEEKPLVGYGAKATSAKRRARVATSPSPAERPRLADTIARDVPHDGGMDPAHVLRRREAGGLDGTDRPRAKPPVRKYAKALGIDLRAVVPSGGQGTITREDVDRAASVRPSSPPPAVEIPASSGREERVPVKGVRKATAAAMVASAFTAPHVTEWLTLDITPTMKLRERLAATRDFAGVKLSPLVFVARALTLAARRHPMINSSWDDAAQEIVVKGDVNLGIAAATPRGLLVPNVKDAGRLSLIELAQAIASLTEVARAGKTAPEAMTGGTITITNVGVFGVDTGTPILNPGESAILAFGAVRLQPWVHKNKVKPRQITTLGLSFDHRVVDGELGSRFLADVGAILADPGVALTF